METASHWRTDVPEKPSTRENELQHRTHEDSSARTTTEAFLQGALPVLRREGIS